MKNFHLCISFKSCIRKSVFVISFNTKQLIFPNIFLYSFFGKSLICFFFSRASSKSWKKDYWNILRQGKLELVKGVLVCEIFRVRLNYATTHQDTPPSTTIQNISTTTYHHLPPAKICPPPCTTTHHQPKYIHHHPPPAKI